MAKITDIVEQKGDSSRVSIFLDGEFAFGISSAVAVQSRLKVGMDIDAEVFLTKAQADLAYSKALFYLSFRARSSAEIKRYLQEKGFEIDAIECALDKLAVNRYICDEDFAASVVRAYCKKEGKYAIKSRLLGAGISEYIIDSVLDYDEAEGASVVAKKYLRTKPFDKEKLWRCLYSKGFSSDIIGEVIEQFGSDSEVEID